MSVLSVIACLCLYIYITLTETNIAPENQRLRDDFSSWGGLFSGAMAVSGSVHIVLMYACLNMYMIIMYIDVVFLDHYGCWKHNNAYICV